MLRLIDPVISLLRRRCLRGVLAVLLGCQLFIAGGVSAQDYTVNLNDTDIQEFIKFVADVTGTTIGH
jgi:general secretion pathway protein D